MDTKHCNKCDTTKPIDDFSFRNKAMGLRCWLCRDCQNAASKANYTNNRKRHIKTTVAATKRRAQQFRLQLLEAKRACKNCGADHPAVLDFHHRDPKTKVFNIAKSHRIVSKARLEAEMEKCDVLCSNCHRIEHWNQRHI